jgi:hypothetical protein
LKWSCWLATTDSETNDSVYSANAAASLQSIGVQIVCGQQPFSVEVGDVNVHFISWRNSHAELLSDMKALRKRLEGDNHDIVIHTSVNKAIPTMPDVGIDAQELKDIGFQPGFVWALPQPQRSPARCRQCWRANAPELG